MEGDLCQDQLQPASNRFVSVSSLLSVLCTVYCVLCPGPSSLLPVNPPSLPAPAFPASSVPAWASHSDAISPSLRSWEVSTSDL